MNEKMSELKKVFIPLIAMLLMAGACSNTTKEEGVGDSETIALAEGGSLMLNPNSRRRKCRKGIPQR